MASPWVAGATLAFLRAGRQRPHPMPPADPFASRPFAAAVGTAFLDDLACHGALLALPLALRAQRGTSEGVGPPFAPMTAATAAGALMLGRIVARAGSRVPAAARLAMGAADRGRATAARGRGA